jgi:hypothetical protein
VTAAGAAANIVQQCLSTIEQQAVGVRRKDFLGGVVLMQGTFTIIKAHTNRIVSC